MLRKAAGIRRSMRRRGGWDKDLWVVRPGRQRSQDLRALGRRARKLLGSETFRSARPQNSIGWPVRASDADALPAVSLRSMGPGSEPLSEDFLAVGRLEKAVRLLPGQREELDGTDSRPSSRPAFREVLELQVISQATQTPMGGDEEYCLRSRTSAPCFRLSLRKVRPRGRVGSRGGAELPVKRHRRSGVFASSRAS